MVDCVCRICGAKFQVIPSKYKNGRGKYCSRKCKDNSLIGVGVKNAKKFNTNNIPWNVLPIGNTVIRVDDRGNKRYYVKVSDKPFKWERRSHYVWKNYYKKEIDKKSVIHHKDGNSMNDDITNLQKMTRADHTKLHCTKPRFTPPPQTSP
jgi:hypothetical protein